MQINSSPKIIKGKSDARGMRIAIVASRFNSIFVDRLVQTAISTLQSHGAEPSDICVAHVPGAYELPIVALRLAHTKRYDAIIALGAVIKGDTDHYDVVVRSAEQGLMLASLQTGVPITNGMITVYTQEQALERSGGKCGNLGHNAALAAIETVNTLRQIE